MYFKAPAQTLIVNLSTSDSIVEAKKEWSHELCFISKEKGRCLCGFLGTDFNVYKHKKTKKLILLCNKCTDSRRKAILKDINNMGNGISYELRPATRKYAKKKGFPHETSVQLFKGFMDQLIPRYAQDLVVPPPKKAKISTENVVKVRKNKTHSLPKVTVRYTPNPY